MTSSAERTGCHVLFALLCRRWIARLADGGMSLRGRCRNAEGKQPHAWQSSAASASSHKEGEQGQVPVLHADTDDAAALLNEEVHCLQAGQEACGSTSRVCWA